MASEVEDVLCMMSSCLSVKGEYCPQKEDMLSDIVVSLHGIPFPFVLDIKI